MPQLPEKVRKLRDAVLDGAAHTSPELRRAVAARAADGPGPGADVPEDLRRWVDTVARDAYRTTDGDVEDLRAAGYGEDEIFEITVSAALGAGLLRMERGLAALAAGAGDGG